MKTEALTIKFFKKDLPPMTPELAYSEAVTFVKNNMKPIRSLGYTKEDGLRKELLAAQGKEPIIHYDYYAWEDGHVYHIQDNKVYRSTNNSIAKNGYPTYRAGGKMHTVARLVYEAYFGEPAVGEVVIPKDKDKLNTCPDNLTLAVKGSSVEKERLSYLRGMQDLIQKHDEYPTFDLNELYNGFKQLNINTNGVVVYFNGKEVK